METTARHLLWILYYLGCEVVDQRSGNGGSTIDTQLWRCRRAIHCGSSVTCRTEGGREGGGRRSGQEQRAPAADTPEQLALEQAGHVVLMEDPQ